MSRRLVGFLRAFVLALTLMIVLGCSSDARPRVVSGTAPLAPNRIGVSTASTGAAPATLTPPRPFPGFAGRVVLIDAGHNGDNAAHLGDISRLVNIGDGTKPCDTTGTQTDAGYPEHAFNFDVAVKLAAIISAAGGRPVLTRSTDTGWGPCITDRAAIGNVAHADVAVSIHADGGPATGSGFHVIYPALIPGYTDRIVSASRELALDVRDAFVHDTGETSADYIGQAGIAERSDLGGLNLSTAPKVFIECANMRNKRDAALTIDASWREKAALGIAEGLYRFLIAR